MLTQDLNTEFDGAGNPIKQPTIAYLSSKDLESKLIHTFMIFENDGTSDC